MHDCVNALNCWPGGICLPWYTNVGIGILIAAIVTVLVAVASFLMFGGRR